MFNSKNIPLVVGIGVWLVLLLLQRPDLRHDAWAALILQLAALVWVPLIPHFVLDRHRLLVMGAALSLVLAFQIEQGLGAALATLPWLLVTLWQFKMGVDELLQRNRTASQIAISSGRIFMVIGGLWTLSDRLDWQPLNFTPAIVLLTGVHFHYAGLIFPTLAGLAAARWPSQLLRWSCVLAVISVPMTAVGVTLTQVFGAHFFEAIAAITVSLSGWMAAIGYAKIIYQRRLPLATRLAWSVFSLGLLFSMTLALGYAIRPYYMIEVLTIPNMRALHGTVNAFCVAGAGLVGWRFAIN